MAENANILYFRVFLDKLITARADIDFGRKKIDLFCRYCNQVIRYQTHYRLNEARGRFGAEELNGRVQWWSLVQAIVILCSGLGQVLVLKTFFTEKQVKKPRSQSTGYPSPMTLPTNKI